MVNHRLGESFFGANASSTDNNNQNNDKNDTKIILLLIIITINNGADGGGELRYVDQWRGRINCKLSQRQFKLRKTSTHSKPFLKLRMGQIYTKHTVSLRQDL